MFKASTLIIAVASIVSVATAQADTDVLVYGLSKHFVACHVCKNKQFNEENYGAGIQHTLNKQGAWTFIVKAATYKDSYSAQARLVVGGVRWQWTDKVRVGADAGWMRGSDFHGLGGYPVVSFKVADKVSVEMPGSHEVVGVWLKVGL